MKRGEIELYVPEAGDAFMSEEERADHRQAFKRHAETILRRHLSQDMNDVSRLRDKYRDPVIGQVEVHELISMLGMCIDPSDQDLCCTSQLTHSLQVASAMTADHVSEDLILVALIHDLGKLLLLQGEDPANVVGPNEPLEPEEALVGLDNVAVQWNHDEFVFSRFQAHLPYELSWLLRYHSLRFIKAEPYMSQRDRRLHQDLALVFRRYDLCTKCPYVLPGLSLEDFRPLLAKYFPKPILF